VPTISFLGIRYLNRRWNLKISQEEAEMLSQIGLNGVTFVEQSFKYATKGDTTNKMKRDVAAKFILEHAAKRGVKIDKATAESLVEIAVYRLKDEKQQENHIEE
jgi:hypothetical protein